jgi:hypothetical protein
MFGSRRKYLQDPCSSVGQRRGEGRGRKGQGTFQVIKVKRLQRHHTRDVI